MKFFGISQHISGMADIRGVLASISPAHTVDDLTLSAHHWVMGREKDRAPMLDGDEWRGAIERKEWDRFHAEWRDRLDAYDAFLCFYPPAFAFFYQRFDKPIICQVPIRYEYPWHDDPDGWNEFNSYLRAGADGGKIVLCANNPYDAAYMELFLQRPVRYVPSLCEYTGVEWRPERSNVVYYSNEAIPELDGSRFVPKARALPRGHQWRDVASFRAIAHFPYNVSTMSIIEQYAMGVPLLFPTLDYAMSLQASGVRLFEQNSWAGTFHAAPGSAIVPPRGFPEGHDPNDYADPDSLRYWLRYADYYDPASMPGLTYFSSLEELRAIANESPAFFENAHARMRRLYPQRRQRAIDGWRAIIDDLR
jgi:hypothetical protein